MAKRSFETLESDVSEKVAEETASQPKKAPPAPEPA
jgi:hypothetical protein